MLYTLWDMESNNFVAAYDSRQQALLLVLEGIKRNGPHDTDTLALEVEDEHGDGHLIAYGQELAELARREFSSERVAR